VPTSRTSRSTIAILRTVFATSSRRWLTITIVIPVAASEYLAAHLPAGRLLVMEQAGHWLQLEQPQAFEQALREFLRG